MLHTETVEPSTLAALNKICAALELAGFQLSGDTSLALQIGHRISIGLYFYSPNIDFDEKHLLRVFQSLGDTLVVESGHNRLSIQFNEVKIEVQKYSFPLIREALKVDGVSLVSKQDIVAMKLFEMASHAAKKDFYDVYFLLREFSITEMLGFYTHKFGIPGHFQVLRSLTFFDDAEEEVEPEILGDVSWSQVKARIEKSVRNYVMA